MTLPRILVVDDQYVHDLAERRHFLRHTKLRDHTSPQSEQNSQVIAEAIFCSGQRKADGVLSNDYFVVAETITRFGENAFALVLLDMRFDSGALNQDGEPRGRPGDDEFGEILRRKLAAKFPKLPIVILTSKRHSDLVEREVAYLSKEGINDIALTASLLRFGRLEIAQTRSLLGLSQETVAQAPATLMAFKKAWFAAPTGQSILIVGDTGVGKEVLARYIHNRSGRREFVGLNISAVPSALFESEMFGALKGAFTGLNSDRQGFFERADGGTLFLDEIADMEGEAQAKILRALEERHAYRVGERRPYEFDVRLLAATSRDLRARVAAGQFREDFYYRIAAETIAMPPLRERRQDIAGLASSLLEDATRVSGKFGISLAPEAERMLEDYNFPGNVRELRHLMARVAAGVGHNQIVLAHDIQRMIDSLPEAKPFPLSQAKPAEMKDSVKRKSQPLSTGVATSTSDRRELAGALKGASEHYGRAVFSLLEQALEQTRHIGKERDRDLGDLNPTRAMKLLLGRSDLTTVQAADEIKRIGATTGEPPVNSLSAQALEWARRLRGISPKAGGRSTRAPT